MSSAILWLEATFARIPLPVLEVWGWLSCLVGFALALLAFGGFTFRLGERWGLGRERQAWDAKALWCMPLTFVLVASSGYFGSFIILVPGAQTFESLKDLAVFLCVVLFGYPALLTIPFAYGLSDLIEGVPPEFLLGWLPGYFINPACFWIAYQLIGKNPDFRQTTTWFKYLGFVAAFMSLEPVLWGFICSGRYTAEVSYRQITSALVFTTSITWCIAPFVMIVALPLARRFGLFWAEIKGHVKERPLRQPNWVWEAGTSDIERRPISTPDGLPLRMFILLPFIGLVLVMVAATAYVTLRSAETDAGRLAVRLHEEIAENIGLRLDEALRRDRELDDESMARLLETFPSSKHGSALLFDRRGNLVASSRVAKPILESAAASLRREVSNWGEFSGAVQFSFDHLTVKPLSRESWLAHAAPYKDPGSEREWIVLTIIPEAFYLAGVRTGNARSAMIFALALVSSLGLAALLAARVTEPLRNISQATRALAEGSLTVRVPMVKLEELGTLARSFNEMAAQLQSSFDALVSEVETRKSRERELEQSETRLKTSEDRIQLAVRAANLGIWDWDVKADELLWDDSMYRLYGVNRSEFSGALEAWTERLLAEDAVSANEDVQAALRGERDFESEFRIRSSDGSIRFIRGIGQTIRDREGHPLRMVGINWDVTERRKIEGERSRLLHDLGERVKELGLLHAASRLLQRDRPFDRTLLEELVGQMPRAWQYPECCEARISYMDLEVSTAGFRDSPFRQSKAFSTSDGDGVLEVIYKEARPAAAEGPFIAEERALIDSLSDMLVGYLELRKHQAGLEALVRDRTAALNQAKEQAETANQAKSAFLATMSHEIRTPMNAILGFGQLLQRESDLTSRDRGRLDKLLRNGYHLLELINNVLEMSKIEAGRTEAVSATFDLHRTISDVDAMVRERIETKGLRFEVTGVEKVPRHVQADAPKLRQILINLLGNATKFTDFGSITLSVHQTSANERLLLSFSVADTGIGIAPAERQRIFEPFYQTNDSARSLAGTGLGLTICADFARLLGGTLDVESEAGKGSRFTLGLPVTLGSSAELSAESTSVGQVVELAPGQSIPTLLIVDDDPDNRAVLSELLVSVGLRVLEAEDGTTALELIAKQRPDLIFMDVKMPTMTGVEAITRIRACEGAHSIPIVIVSASAFRDERTSFLATGAREFIAKPFREVEIWSLLERLLGLRFVYELEANQHRDSMGPTRQQVLALGDATLSQLRDALDLGYVGRVESILTDLPSEHRETVAALAELARGLELERLKLLLAVGPSDVNTTRML